MGTANLSVSVILCAYTEARWNDLLAAVASVQAQTVAPREIVVVIDHNPPLYERVQAALAGVQVIENRQARGLSGARNTGLEAAQGEIIAFMDEDAAAARDWLERLTAAYADPQVIGVGGAIHAQWQGGRPRWFPDEFDWVVGCTYRGMPMASAPVRNLIGCNMSFRRSVYTAIGGFRDGIGRIGTRPLGCEETEFCIRANERWPDQRFVYEPTAQVFHNVPASRRRWSYFRSRCYAEGRSKALIAQFIRRGNGLSSESAYTFKTLPKGVLRCLRDALLRLDPAGIGRAAAIIAGLAVTTAGYVWGTISLRLSQADGSAAASRISSSQP